MFMLEKSFDAIALLQAGNREIELMFVRIGRRGISNREKEALASDIAEALTVQVQLLEEIAFPAFLAAGVNASVLDPAKADQYAIEELIGDLQDCSCKEDTLDGRVRSLSNWVKRLIKRTESEAFVEARRAGADLAAIGLRLAARKSELKAGVETPLSH
jgi:hypothetical protein